MCSVPRTAATAGRPRSTTASCGPATTGRAAGWNGAPPRAATRWSRGCCAAEPESIVEIGPGAGRFSEVLAERAERLVLVDVTDEALRRCREHLGERPGVEYVRTDGASLPGVEGGSVDLVWSFEAFVHMQPVDVAAYVGEIARVLRPGGRAVIHHAGRRDRSGWRAPMSAALFARLARDRGLEVESQETWGTYDDVISVLLR